MPKIIDVWKVHHWDGGERHNFAYYMDRSAYSETEMKVLLPRTSAVIPDVLVIFESMEEVEDANIQNARRSAWQKLLQRGRLALKLEKPED